MNPSKSSCDDYIEANMGDDANHIIVGKDINSLNFTAIQGCVNITINSGQVTNDVSLIKSSNPENTKSYFWPEVE